MKVSMRVQEAQNALDRLEKAEETAGTFRDARKQAFFYKDVVKPIMEELRRPCDELEKLVDREMWPFPTYEDLMFEV